MTLMRNRIKPFVDSLGLSVYQFRKDTGIANKTAYDLYNNPEQYPGKNVMEAICQVYNVQPGLLLEYISESSASEISPVGSSGQVAIATPVDKLTRKRKKGGDE